MPAIRFLSKRLTFFTKKQKAERNWGRPGDLLLARLVWYQERGWERERSQTSQDRGAEGRSQQWPIQTKRKLCWIGKTDWIGSAGGREWSQFRPEKTPGCKTAWTIPLRQLGRGHGRLFENCCAFVVKGEWIYFVYKEKSKSTVRRLATNSNCSYCKLKIKRKSKQESTVRRLATNSNCSYCKKTKGKRKFVCVRDFWGGSFVFVCEKREKTVQKVENPGFGAAG